MPAAAVEVHSRPGLTAELFHVPLLIIDDLGVRTLPDTAAEERRGAIQWWLHHRPRPNMPAAIGELSRYIATARVAKHRLFSWYAVRVCPDCQLIVIARDDDTTFGILHSRFHELRSLRLGTSLEDRPRLHAEHDLRDVPVPSRVDAQRTCG